jgi:hypothetical protein
LIQVRFGQEFSQGIANETLLDSGSPTAIRDNIGSAAVIRDALQGGLK